MFATDDATGKLQAARLVKEQLRALLATGSLADATAAKDRLQVLVERAAQPDVGDGRKLSHCDGEMAHFSTSADSRRRTGSGALSAGGGKRSRSSLSPALLAAMKNCP